VSVYTHAKMRISNGTFGWETSNVRALLVEGSYTYNFIHRNVADVIADEVSGGNYTRVDVPQRDLRVDAPTDRILFWAAGLVFPLLTGVSPTGIVLYDEIGPDQNTPDDDWLVAYLDFGGAVATSGLDFLVAFDADGVFALREC
jgi:hypothetical protein